jgi:hypothetical protein
MRDKKGQGDQTQCHFANYLAQKFAPWLAYSELRAVRENLKEPAF